MPAWNPPAAELKNAAEALGAEPTIEGGTAPTNAGIGGNGGNGS